VRLRQRLLERHLLTSKTAEHSNPIDQHDASLRRNAVRVINNDDSLEELRWNIDDALFSTVTLGKEH